MIEILVEVFLVDPLYNIHYASLTLGIHSPLPQLQVC